MNLTEQVIEKLDTTATLIARVHNSGFANAHDSYNAISMASDGRIYYVLSSDLAEIGGRVYVYDPGTDQISFLADLTDICGERNSNAIAQGKSHVRFHEQDGKLYFSTHVGFYELIDGMDRLPQNAPAGFSLYKGGHILSYDLATQKFEDLALIPNGEGVVSMTMDCQRRHIYGITWPLGNFFHFNVNNKQLKMLGQISGNGEAGIPGDDFRSLCRSLVVDASDGTVYFSVAEGDLFKYHPTYDAIKPVQDVNLRLDYFGKYDATRPGSMGYNWRKIFWHPDENVAYGVHGNSGYLFRFDPEAPKIELIERICSKPSKASGMFDQFSYGYLGFQLGPDKETVYYLTGGPIYENQKRVTGASDIAKGAAKGPENLHLVTYHIPTETYKDHGPIFFADGTRPLYVNSIAVGLDGRIYTLAKITKNGNTRTDLISIPNPLAIMRGDDK